MFEEKTFEHILGSMLSNVTKENAELDTRTGSIIYTALAPIALELETAYREMDMILEETFLDTASKEYLIKHGSQIGVNINEATYGHYKAEFNVDVELGSRFNLDKFNYSVQNKLADPNEDSEYYIFDLVCETAGSEPNGYLGSLTPITYVENFAHGEIISVITYGEDEEETEDFRNRLKTHLTNPPINGNLAQYHEWLDKYYGIGKYKVLPCWNGANTVKVVVLNSEQKSASSELVAEVQNYLDPPTSTINDTTTAADYPQGRGMGNGQATIGAIVTVATATETPVVVNCKVTLNEGYSYPAGVQDAVNEYLESIMLDKTSVEYMPIYAAVYNAPSVKDIVSLKVTVKSKVMDSTVSPFVSSVTIGSEEIAVLDTNQSVWSV